jgi:tocopherol O-methyltransferase
VFRPLTPTNESIAGHYDSLDPYYRDVWGDHVHHGLWLTGRESQGAATEQMSLHVLSSLNLAPGARIADIGCGYGGTARIAAERHGAHVVGLTLSAAQKRYGDTLSASRGSVEIRLQDWKAAEFAPGAFDALISLESLEHIADKAGFARMARHAVRPGGRVAVATWLSGEDVSRWSQKHLLDCICREAMQASLVTAAKVKETFRAAGFSLVTSEDLSPKVSRTWSVIMRRLAHRLLTRRAYWRILVKGRAEDRVFALTAARIWLGYQTGCFRFGSFVWQ